MESLHSLDRRGIKTDHQEGEEAKVSVGESRYPFYMGGRLITGSYIKENEVTIVRREQTEREFSDDL